MASMHAHGSWKHGLVPSWAQTQTWARREWLLLVILAVAVLLRTAWFGAHPAGINQDELSTAYDAYALLRSGIDRNGFGFPVALVAWGGGSMSALPAYLSMPFIALLGPTVTAARLATLLLNLLAFIPFYALAKRLGGRRLALIAVFLLAINPWHVMASRWGHECNLLPAWILFSAWGLASADSKRRWPFLAGCAMAALSVYVYGPALFFAPVFLALASMSLWRTKRIGRAEILDGALTAMLVAVPMALFLAVNQWSQVSIRLPLGSIPKLPGVGRYATSSVFFGKQGAQALWNNTVDTWNILTAQSDGLPWNSVPGFGTLYPWTLALSFAGLLLLIGNTGARRVRRVVLAWMVSALLLGLVVTPNINRLNVLFIPLILAAAVALDALASRRAALGGLLTLYAVSGAMFSMQYFTGYAEDVAPSFQATLLQAVTIAARVDDGPICVTTEANMPYIYALYADRTDPHEFLSTVRYEDEKAEFRRVESFGRFVFGIERCRERTDILTYVVENGRAGEFADAPRAKSFNSYTILSYRP